ncbi:hypothetical protein [Microbacterium sp. 1P10AE]
MATSTAPEHDPLDALFPDPDGVIAALVADLPAPAPESAARVSALLAVR